MKIIKKAYVVYHDGMIKTNPHEGYTDIFEIEPIYADNAGQAKSRAWEPYEYFLDDVFEEYPKYTDLKTKRAKYLDIVEINGQERKRCHCETQIIEDKRKEEIKNLPENEEYLMQDSRSYVGNSVVWWAKNHNGYTCDFEKAHIFTKQELLEHSWRDSDIIWIKSHVEKAIRKHVDAQYLEREFCF